MKRFFLACTVLLSIASCKNDKPAEEEAVAARPAPAAMAYSVVKVYPHDSSAFTEGLFWHNGELYESTGLKGKSRLLKAKLETGKASQKINIPEAFFGEGIAMINNKIYQLTYQEHKVFVYDMDFKKIGEFEWPYEGWGMTTDGKQLILNTGGSNLYFIDPETFKVVRTVGVYNNTGYVDSINEMEFVNGFIYANRWLTNVILKINPQSGEIVSVADLSDIYQRTNLNAPRTDESCLNGIAYDAAKQSFYITGKYWPNLFEVKFN